MAGNTAVWSLTPAQREDTVARVTSNIFAMGFTKGLPISDELALAAATAFERKAYTAAEVAARTTTGNRPHSETTKAYARKLGELVIDMIKGGGQFAEEAAAASGPAGTIEEINLLGSRDFLTKESAEAALAPLLAPGSQVKKIKLSTKSFGRDAAAVAAQGISNAAGSLTSADISDVIAGRPEDEALDVLRTLSAALSGCAVRELNLSDNALGEKGVRACEQVLRTATGLQGLSLQNVGCSIHACRAVEELLQAPGELRSLHLYNNMSDSKGAEHIAGILKRAPQMTDFKMASSRVGPAGGEALAKALNTGRCLVRLDLSDNPLTSVVAPALAALVHAQPHLKVLNVNDTSLTNNGCVTVALAVASSVCPLEELGLALNEITPQGAQMVGLAISSKPTLRVVNLRENELEDKGAVIISKAIAKVPGLQTIDLCGNQLHRVGAVAVAKAAAGACTELQLLALDENMISEEGLDELRSVMKAAGKAAALGSLEENMEESDVELSDDEGAAGPAGGPAAMLAQLMAQTGLTKKA